MESFRTHCARYSVPESLALAIARQESGFQPWAVNIQGKSYFPSSREDALALIKAKGKGNSYDVGLMQINVWWLHRLGISPETAIEPKNNILLGVWILSQEIKRYGLNWKAVASYHTPLSRNPERGRLYAANVVNHIKRFAVNSRSDGASKSESDHE
ncbi:MAG TPA: lytic transglycosylase domain-containing protein [Candidatus Mailhella merdavium]|nr:lytic transglycosylase domain-containing protein [Candidatus Mailhella merdavium]